MGDQGESGGKRENILEEALSRILWEASGVIGGAWGPGKVSHCDYSVKISYFFFRVLKR